MFTKILTIIFIILFLTIAGFLVWSFFFATKDKREHLFSDISNVLHHKHKPDEPERNLSFQERVELSWQFLYTLTSKIMSSFSEHDKERIKICGRMLRNHDARYQHVVDSEPSGGRGRAAMGGKDKTQEGGGRNT